MRACWVVLVVLVVLCALGVAAFCQMVVFSACLFCSPDPSSAWGTRLDNVGDVDADGVEDVVVCDYEVDGSWNYLGDYFPNRRRAEWDLRLVSGRDGRLLHRSGGEADVAEGSLGSKPLGDIDGDGFGDVVLGCMVIDGRSTEFLLRARDGKTWRELWSVQDWGWDAEDWNEEIVFVVPGSDGPIVVLADRENGSFDGRTGRALPKGLHPTTIPAESPSAFSDAEICVGDVNGDSTPDFVNAFGYTGGASDGEILSGADGSVLNTFHLDAPATMFIQPPQCIGDADGDGVNDFSVPLFDYGPGAGRVVTISGATGVKLFEAASAPSWRGVGRDSIALADMDGDGLRELLVTFDVTGVAAYSGERLLWSSP